MHPGSDFAFGLVSGEKGRQRFLQKENKKHNTMKNMRKKELRMMQTIRKFPFSRMQRLY